MCLPATEFWDRLPFSVSGENSIRIAAMLFNGRRLSRMVFDVGRRSDAEDVLRRAPCSVLIVHDHERDFVVSEA
jgi:hypothetical protein